ncbi:MAG: class I SAM-dependent methyltransferase [Clostridiales bacterium]|jgi:16S rRNA (guanine1207-N2)-methyltransferase|nr:class I SAM-dependent methyltransferase [Clostridiales bacterium]
MSHYFIEDNTLKHDIKKIIYYYANNRFEFTTDSGLFSKDHIDPATDILLRTIPPLSGSLLDMGCGYGCIGIVLAKTNSLKLTQADVNQYALELTKRNCIDNGVESNVIKSDCFDGISGSFDTIVINPPIHAGKAVTYKMYEDSFSHLNDGGKLYIVTLKKHGAESTLAKLKDVFGNCETLYKRKGYYVFCCTKTTDRQIGSDYDE